MANRHLSRSIVLQTLFEWDFYSAPEKKNIWSGDKIKEVLKRNLSEFAPGIEEDVFVFELTESIFRKIDILDEIISKAAPEWPIEKISVVDRNILRIGLSELLFGNRKDVPPKVAINEAIELAKTFGGENSSKFVNGVLGAVYKEIGEPGKEEQSKKKETKEVDPHSLPKEKLAGVVAYSLKEGQVHIAFVHDVFGYWTFSKTKVSEGETDEESAIRAAKTEMNIDVKIEEKIGGNEYVATHPDKGKIFKQVVYFLAEAQYGELALGTSGGLDDLKWWKLADIPNLRMYKDMIPLITKAIEVISKR